MRRRSVGETLTYKALSGSCFDRPKAANEQLKGKIYADEGESEQKESQKLKLRAVN